MKSSGLASILHFGASSFAATTTTHFPRRRINSRGLLFQCKIRFSSSSTLVIRSAQQKNEQLLVVVGGGAAGVYAAIRAKNVAPHLNVLVIEKGKPLSKVKVSGGGRCNVTNGHCDDKMVLAEHYPRGNKELRGSFFNIHDPQDTIRWFSDHGVELKTEEDGRVFPVSNNSSSIIDCLLNEAKRSEVLLQTGKVVSGASSSDNGKFRLKIEKRTADFVEYVEADYLLIASGSSRQGYTIALQLGHSLIDPMPSLFTFKIEDTQLVNLSGVTFPKVKAKLKLENIQRTIPQFTQVGPMLVTHWGLSGPVILRLSAWGARDLFLSNYNGTLFVDFMPDIHIEDVKNILFQQKDQLAIDVFQHRQGEFGSKNARTSVTDTAPGSLQKQKVNNSFPTQFGLVKRFWRFVLEREGLDGDISWASIPNNSLNSIALLLKQCPFKVVGKGQFKDEFVTAGGVPLSEISLNTMESRIRPHLYFAGEVLNIDGITGGFNFQNAWTGGYIAGTSIGELASSVQLRKEPSIDITEMPNLSNVNALH